MIDRDKYITFKRADFLRMCGDINSVSFPPGTQRSIDHATNDLLLGALDDAVVIRKRDVFAAPALYAYAATIQSVIEVLEDDPETKDSYRHRISDLRDLADFFAGEADQARQIKGHLPTASG